MENPSFLHSEPHRTSTLTRIIGYMGLGLILLAIVLGGLDPKAWIDVSVLIVLGLVLFGLYWLTAPRHYKLYDKELVITYGKPRQNVIGLDKVSEIEVRRHALGAEIKIHCADNKSVTLYPLNPRRLHEHLQTAFKKYQTSPL